MTASPPTITTPQGAHDGRRQATQRDHPDHRCTDRVEHAERAGQIADPSYRTSFLEQVPENARPLALARAWLGEPDAGRGDPAMRPRERLGERFGRA